MKTELQTFNSEEAAKILGVNVSTIKRWTDEGKLECIKTAGGHRKFLMEHFARFVEQHNKRASKVNLFPLEKKADLQISYLIMKSDYPALIEMVRKNALLGRSEIIQQILNGLYLGQHPLYRIYDEILVPVLHQIGEMWAKEKITVIEEHLGAQLIRDSIIRLQGIIRLPQKKSRAALCLNLSSELHDIALKMVHHLLELRGFNVLYSGQITPVIGVEKVVKSTRPERIYISSTVVEFKLMVQKEFDEICAIAGEIGSRIFVGGRGFDQLSFEHPAVEKRLTSFEEVFRN